MSNLVILKWRLFEYKAIFEKKVSFIRSEIGIFDMCFKRLYCAKKVLKIYKSIVIENIKPVPQCPIKWRRFKDFAKLYKSPLLIANMVKNAVSDLRQFLATECP